MIKREGSSSSVTPPPASQQQLPSSTTTTASDITDDADNDNGKDKKYQRHGSLSESIQRWTTRHGKGMVVCITTLVFSVFLIPPLKVLLQLPTTTHAQHDQLRNNNVAPIAIASAKTTTTQKQEAIQIVTLIPACPITPWKLSENLQGKCPGDLKPFAEATSLSQCASTCCTNPECISWQYRQDDVGCIQGKDVRLGQEKDGPAAWCSDHPPHKWQGQFLKPHGDKQKIDEKEVRSSACSEDTWNAKEEIGQCFGLGDVKENAGGSAEECMRACCDDVNCGAWQWNKELGCFYGKGMHSCQGHGDPVAFEPFIGRRKQLDSRRYTDKHGKTWQMTMA